MTRRLISISPGEFAFSIQLKLGSLTALALLGLVGCQTPENTFDAHYEGTLVDLPFKQVKLDHGVKSHDLIAPTSSARLGPGDTVQIELVKELGGDDPDAVETCVVMNDGLLYFNLVGGVMAANKTVKELEDTLTEALQESGELPGPAVINVNVSDMGSRNFTVLGQVANQGSFPFPEPVPLLDAIARCGGVSLQADLRRSVIIRDNRLIAPDFQALIERGDMSQNMYLRPGDYVFIPLIGQDKVHVLGQVNNPSLVPYEPELSLIRAIVAAGGPTTRAAVRRVSIVRGSSVAPKIATVDLGEIMKGESPDFRLQPDDIIWIPTSPWQKLEEYASEAVRSAVTSLANRVSREATGGSRRTGR